MSSTQPNGTTGASAETDGPAQDQEALNGTPDVPTGFKVTVAAVAALITFGFGVFAGKRVVRRFRSARS